MGILGKTIAVVLLAMGLSSAQLLFGLRLVKAVIDDAPSLEDRFSQVPPNLDTLTAEELSGLPAVDLSFDSTQAYMQLIVDEHEKTKVGSNILGSVVLGTMDAFWLVLLFAGIEAEEDQPENGGEAVAKAFSVPILYILGITGLVVTTPFLVYNVYRVATRGRHVRQRDEYYRSYNAYVKRRAEARWNQSLVKVYVAPSFDVASSAAGVNVLVQF